MKALTMWDSASPCGSRWRSARNVRLRSTCWTAAICGSKIWSGRTQPGVEVFVPPKPARKPCGRNRELEPKPGDSAAVRAWKQRMASEAGKQIYKQRAATSETVNADLRSYRGLTQITVRGLAKAKCVALWCALAYNVMHFGTVLLR